MSAAAWQYLWAAGGLPLLWAAFAVDRVVGDPRALPHPVVWMGKAITLLERAARPQVKAAVAERVVGTLLVAFVVALCYFLAWGLVRMASAVHPWVGWLAAVWIASTTIASKGLQDAGLAVARPLEAGQLQQAREQVAQIVGRDTAALNEREVVRAAVETVAENTVDAIVAPLFYAAIGGAPLAVAYRAVNTLDSMWGYRSERYRYFGWAAARLDDAANWLPARITGALLPLAALLVRADGRRAWRTILRDAHRHPSPNGGIPEAGVAGALGIRLGGWNAYGGKRQFRAYMGEPLRPLAVRDIARSIHLMHAVSGLFLVAVSVAAGMRWWLWGS